MADIGSIQNENSSKRKLSVSSVSVVTLQVSWQLASESGCGTSSTACSIVLPDAERCESLNPMREKTARLGHAKTRENRAENRT